MALRGVTLISVTHGLSTMVSTSSIQSPASHGLFTDASVEHMTSIPFVMRMSFQLCVRTSPRQGKREKGKEWSLELVLNSTRQPDRANALLVNQCGVKG